MLVSEGDETHLQSLIEGAVVLAQAGKIDIVGSEDSEGSPQDEPHNQ